MKKSAIVLGCSLIAMVSHANPITTHYDNTCVFKNPLMLPTMEFKCLNDNLIELNHNYEYYTLINQDGKIIIPKYQSLSYTSGGYFDIIIDNKEGQLDAFGNMIIPAHYDHIGYSKTDDFIPAIKNKKHGYINRQGKEVIPFIYDNVSWFSEGLAIVHKKDEKNHTINSYIINEQGKKVFDMPNDITGSSAVFSDGLLMVIKDNKTGFLDKTGKLVIDYHNYDHTNAFKYGVSIVRKNDKYGIIDKKGKIIIPLKYKSIEFVNRNSMGNYPDEYFIKINHNDKTMIANLQGKILPIDYNLYRLPYTDKDNKPLYTAHNDKGAAIVNKDQKFIVPFGIYKYIRGYDNFLITEKELSKNTDNTDTDDFYAHNKGIIDTTGKVLFEPKYHIEAINNASENDKYFAIASKDDKNVVKVGVLNANAQFVFPMVYDTVEMPYSDFFILHKDGKVALYENEVQRIPFEYQAIKFLHKTIWAVKKNKKWALVNQHNQPLTNFDYDEIGKIKYGLIPVQQNGQWGLLNHQFKPIIPSHYHFIEILDNGAIVVGVSNGDTYRYGLINQQGTLLTKLDFDEIQSFGSNTVIATKGEQDDKKYGILDISGKIILPIRYDNISISNTKTALLHLDNQEISIDRNGKIVEQID